jgi:hypothetical protein
MDVLFWVKANVSYTFFTIIELTMDLLDSEIRFSDTTYNVNGSDINCQNIRFNDA